MALGEVKGEFGSRAGAVPTRFEEARRLLFGAKAAEVTGPACSLKVSAT